MAFTGAAVIQQVSDSIVRITGLSLAGSAAGTIGLSTSTATPGVALPASFKPTVYTYDGTSVPLQASVEATVMSAAIGIVTSVPVAIVKTGTTLADFIITLTNTTASTLSPNLEIYVKYHE